MSTKRLKHSNRPLPGTRHEGRMRRRLAAAIADELWCRYGMDGKLDWLRAERHLSRIVELARGDAQHIARTTRLTEITGLFPL